MTKGKPVHISRYVSGCEFECRSLEKTVGCHVAKIERIIPNNKALYIVSCGCSCYRGTSKNCKKRIVRPKKHGKAIT